LEFEKKYLENLQIQIGIFSKRQKAEDIARKYKSFEHPSYIKKIRINGKVLYKTILKNFKSSDDINTFKNKMNINDAFII
jgi:hypothetical protein